MRYLLLITFFISTITGAKSFTDDFNTWHSLTFNTPAILEKDSNKKLEKQRQSHIEEVESLKQQQIKCLAENIFYEASTQSYKGKLAVGFVVLNRVKHSQYADDVCGVVYERNTTKSGKTVCQFSWTCKIKKMINFASKGWIHSLQAAKQIIEAQARNDVTNGATHYHADYVRPPWADTLRKVAVIDDHIFYR